MFYAFIDCERNLSLEIKSEIRQNYINTITNKKRRNQSIAVWALLESVVRLLYSCDFEYVCDKGVFSVLGGKFTFSLTHSNNLVAIIISENEPVGVDAELVSDKILKLSSKKDTQNLSETALYQEKKELTKLWTKKESFFKAKNALKGQYRFIKDNQDEYCLYASSNSHVEFIKFNFSSI